MSISRCSSTRSLLEQASYLDQRSTLRSSLSHCSSFLLSPCAVDGEKDTRSTRAHPSIATSTIQSAYLQMATATPSCRFGSFPSLLLLFCLLAFLLSCVYIAFPLPTCTATLLLCLSGPFVSEVRDLACIKQRSENLIKHLRNIRRLQMLGLDF